ncbi:MAG: oxygen-independent coproporphyrinogen III oxidase [Bacteroidota bacterium]
MSLIQKYNIPAPRYTSYPTVPYWDVATFSAEAWMASAVRAFDESNANEGISLYIHLPFCESLCTFCGCNKRITKNHSVEEPYLAAILKEWEMYLSQMAETPLIRDLHIGGGSPTFFAPANLRRLMQGILAKAKRHPKASFSFEASPVSIKREHLAALAELGFDRVSFGIQDFDLKVQMAINRLQPFKMVERATRWARELRYRSINFDVIYGLPFQTEASVHDTFAKVQQLRPDRIAYYSYAHVPWIKGNGQRKFSKEDLPCHEQKRRLYEIGGEHLQEMGYLEIGMDHFALPEDNLYRAVIEGTLHRNFMGYVEDRTELMIGLGVSAISDSWYGFAQNEKKLKAYYARLDANEIPAFRGHILTEVDLPLRQHILDLMCRFETQWQVSGKSPELQACLQRLREPLADGLVELMPAHLKVTEAGKPFIRNIGMAFDQRLWAKQPESQLFSLSI